MRFLLLFFCFATTLGAQPDPAQMMARSMALNRSLLAQPPLTSKGKALQKDSFLTTLNSLIAYAEANPSDALWGSIFDNIVLLHNASIDRDMLLRQKMRRTDEETFRLFNERDSLLRLLGKQYEYPLPQRRGTAELEQAANEREETVLTRLQKNKAHFKALSLVVAEAIYRRDPTPATYLCYQKIRRNGGDEALAEQIYRYARKTAIQALQWQQLRDNLDSHQVHIEFITYQRPSDPEQPIRYAALLLRKSDPAPRWVPLCTQKQINALLGNRPDDELYLQYLYTLDPELSDNALSPLIWSPLLPYLQGIEQVCFAPAGDLHRINIAALYPTVPAPEFVCINSARSLINPSDIRLQGASIDLPCRATPDAYFNEIDDLLGNTAFNYYGDIQTNDAILIGNVFYDMDSAAIRAGITYKAGFKQDSAAVFSPRKRRMAGRNTEWEFLYGTKQEVEAIARILRKANYGVTIQQGYAASEETLKAIGNQSVSPRILHIATHGFFLADDEAGSDDHPLNRAGLVLAGANYAWLNGVPKPGMEDGILTAFEIGQLRLQNTELVVLSACETGLGYIENNEGVWGLQRAFKRAGVRNVLVSLWSIPDEATHLLMSEFYKNCLEKGLPLRKALQEAQVWMQTQEAYQNPFYWAGFVLLE